mmetsp:Transcript_55849/g.88857  ORF Transcript_55849/g.88857 Transcript_55849/m.88857 type:complete len:98 (+) Transcript_55849:37-330(+)
MAYHNKSISERVKTNAFLLLKRTERSECNLLRTSYKIVIESDVLFSFLDFKRDSTVAIHEHTDSKARDTARIAQLQYDKDQGHDSDLGGSALCVHLR